MNSICISGSYSIHHISKWLTFSWKLCSDFDIVQLKKHPNHRCIKYWTCWSRDVPPGPITCPQCEHDEDVEDSRHLTPNEVSTYQQQINYIWVVRSLKKNSICGLACTKRSEQPSGPCLPMLKIRRLGDPLIFNLGISILIRWHRYILRAPLVPCKIISKTNWYVSLKDVRSLLE